MPLRPLSSLAAAALVSLAAGGGTTPEPLPFPPASPTASPDPSVPGPFPVGVRTVTYQDLDRKQPDGTPRTLVTEIWYPAVQATRGKPGVSYDVRTVFTPEQQAALAGVSLDPLPTAAVRDAPPARDHGPFPLIVFSHGQGGIRWQSTYYTVVLASHGYIVVSPDHPGDTLAEAVRGTLESPAYGVFSRPADVSFLLDTMTALPKSDPLAGLADLARVGVTGHSFGALTALRVAAIDARVKAIVPQAPTGTDVAWVGLKKPVVLSIPVLIQGAHDDHTLPWNDNVAPAWASLQRPRWLLDITHGGHFTFSDLCKLDLARLADQIKLDVPGANVQDVLNDGCGPNATPASIAEPLIDQFAIGFFNGALRGDKKATAALTQATADRLAPGAAAVTADP